MSRVEPLSAAAGPEGTSLYLQTGTLPGASEPVTGMPEASKQLRRGLTGS